MHKICTEDRDILHMYDMPYVIYTLYVLISTIASGLHRLDQMSYNT